MILNKVIDNMESPSAFSEKYNVLNNNVNTIGTLMDIQCSYISVYFIELLVVSEPLVMRGKIWLAFILIVEWMDGCLNHLKKLNPKPNKGTQHLNCLRSSGN